VRFDKDFMASLAESHGAAWNQSDAGLVIFDFFRNTDDHQFSGVGAGGVSIAAADGTGGPVLVFGPRPSAIREAELSLPVGLSFCSV
jgi:hypothetical protein